MFEKTNKSSRSDKLVLLNIQYIHTFSDIEFLCGASLKKKGYRVAAIVCPGLDYCEREDYLSNKPDCRKCRKKTYDYCNSYGVEIIEPRQGNSKPNQTDLFIKNGSLNSKIEYTYRNYIHYKKSFSYLDYDLWIRIERSIDKFASYIRSLDINPEEVEKIITANGRFFQTGLPLDIIKTRSGFVTTEVFNDYKVIFGHNEFSMNNELELTKEELLNLKYEPSKATSFMDSKGELKIGGVNLQNDNQLEEIEQIKERLQINQYEQVVTFFPHVMWDSTWFGLGYFSHSPASFIAQLNKIAVNFPRTLFVIKAHPGETNVPAHIAASGSIFSDLSIANISLQPNLSCIEATDSISSYSLGDLSKHIIMWNGTLGLEFAARGKEVISIANSYYDKFNITRRVTSLAQLEALLSSGQQQIELSSEQAELAKRLIYTTRYLKRTISPVHKNTICTKYIMPSVFKKETIFMNKFAEYFEGKIGIYELNELMSSS